ncbi:MAG TPA: uroporphyrinogen decarboxylase family protein [bacterium]|nr:uroporphyrinogen decarboxylase family protein [bacterium]HPR88468.1 uroporphyrinogen decarboxylase family protein [bacterium]
MTDLLRTPQQRVHQALSFQKSDRTPRDFAAVPEIWSRLGDHFNTRDRNTILDRLDIDCRVVSYDSFCRPPEIEHDQVDMEASQERSSVGGMWRRVEADGSNRDIWGAHRQRVANAFGELDQFVSYPLEAAASLDDLKAYNWPTPAWWDFSQLRAAIAALNRTAMHSIRYRVGSVFETAWSLYSFERFLLDLAMAPAMPLYVMERIAEVHLHNLERVLETAGDGIDIVYFYDDLASQNSLLMRPEMYDRFIRPFHQRIIDLAGRHGKPVMIHCCGAVFPLIPRFIDMGIRILNPVQPTARDMAPENLAREFGGRMVFHGGIDIQGFLPTATPEAVRSKVAETCRILGPEGGYILSGSHHIQADTPIDNVLAMYSL